MVTDTKPEFKTCSKCTETKEFDKFIKQRNICKPCANASKKAKYDAAVIDSNINKTCNECNQTKSMIDFVKHRNRCNDCNNEKRRERYETDENHRLYAIQKATEFKQKKASERRETRLAEIGDGNKKCSKCSSIKSDNGFRNNRLKCKDCERDEPIDKFKRTVRGRIISALENKSLHTVEYLGCSSIDYANWILNYDERYTIDNRGTEWHIDHVIPLSHFDLNDPNEQLIAFNWKNTMPLSAQENLSKNRRILPLQIEQHIKFLIEYHKQKNIVLSNTFIDLFAKHLVDGNPLKQSLLLTSGNFGEDLG